MRRVEKPRSQYPAGYGTGYKQRRVDIDVDLLARATAAVSGAETLAYHREWAMKVVAEYRRLSAADLR